MAPTSHILANAGRAGLRSGQCTSNEALSNRMVRVLVKRVKPRAGQLSAVHVGTVLRLARDPDSGKSVHLPGGVEVRRERDSLCFRPVKNGPRDVDARGTRFEYSVDLRAGDADLYLVEHSCLLRFQTIDWLRQGRETRTTGAVLDRDKLGVSLVVRNWRPGDRMHPLGHRKSHGLSRLLNELGVSRWEKAGWPVLVCGGSIAWARGLAAAVEFAAGESTQKGVMITEVPLTQAWQT